MATRHHRVPIEQQQKGIAPGKQQKAPMGGNRKALGDIGNLVNVNKAKQEEGRKQQVQITRPVTRSFGALLLKNAQSAIDGAAGAKKPVKLKEPARQPKAVLAEKTKIDKPPPVTETAVIVEIPEKIPVKEFPSVVKRSSKKKTAHAFSSILSARSKAACGITSRSLERVLDIDAADADDELAVVDYIDDIYKFYKKSEGTLRPSDYMGGQAQINEKMRSILVDWLIEVHNKFELMPETLYLAVNIIDRYLSLQSVIRKDFQLLGMSSMLIACKYEEIWAPEVVDFMAISEDAYDRKQILEMEKIILDNLKWNITVPTPYVFLVRFIKAAAPSDATELENMASFFAELALMQYNFAIHRRPSFVAAAAVYAARRTLRKTEVEPVWTETLQLHAGFTEEELKDCAGTLIEMHRSIPESRLRAAFKKYSNSRFGSVALLPVASKILKEIPASS